MPSRNHATKHINVQRYHENPVESDNDTVDNVINISRHTRVRDKMLGKAIRFSNDEEFAEITSVSSHRSTVKKRQIDASALKQATCVRLTSKGTNYLKSRYGIYVNTSDILPSNGTVIGDEEYIILMPMNGSDFTYVPVAYVMPVN